MLQKPVLINKRFNKQLNDKEEFKTLIYIEQLHIKYKLHN